MMPAAGGVLIKTADVPIAAPSANASGKPSPTTARHVRDDLDGRIEMILDGGACDVGVESTVVDGLSNPPAILRPGGVSIEEIRNFEGWENTVRGYRDGAQGSEKPKAPGMKYRHYAPKARVVLLERHGFLEKSLDRVRRDPEARKIGLLRTRAEEHDPMPPNDTAMANGHAQGQRCENGNREDRKEHALVNGTSSSSMSALPITESTITLTPTQSTRILTLHLGASVAQVAQKLFAGLRDLDQEGVETIYVESIDDGGGGAAAAVMNRLRKAAEGSAIVDLGEH